MGAQQSGQRQMHEQKEEVKSVYQRQLEEERRLRQLVEERHQRELEEERHKRKLEEERYQKQLQVERRWNLEKIMEEKKRSEELKKQTEEIERKLKESQQYQQQEVLHQRQEEKPLQQLLEDRCQHQQKEERQQQGVGLYQQQEEKSAHQLKEERVGPHQYQEAKIFQQKMDGYRQKQEEKSLHQSNSRYRYKGKEEHQQEEKTVRQLSADRHRHQQERHQHKLEGERHHGQLQFEKLKHFGEKRKTDQFRRQTEKTEREFEDLEKQNNIQELSQICPTPARSRSLCDAVLQDSMVLKWSPMPPNKSFIVVKIPEDADEFREVEDLFTSSTKKFKIVQIDRIQNPYLLGCYMFKGLELQERYGNVTEKFLFRGTKFNFVHNICQDNFNWRMQGESKGVSFSQSSFWASKHTDKNSERKVMFLVRVLISESMEDMSFSPPLAGKWHGINNQNNVMGVATAQTQDGKVIVKCSDNDFYPQYLIHYTMRPPNQRTRR